MGFPNSINFYFAVTSKHSLKSAFLLPSLRKRLQDKYATNDSEYL